MKAIVFYYSKSNTTRITAEEIAAKFQADVFPIESKRKADSTQPQNSAFGNYTLYFLGSPAWSGRLPSAIKAFVENLNLGDRDVFLFLTSEGNSTDKATADLRRLMEKRKATVLGELKLDCTGLDETGIREKAKQAVQDIRL